MSLLLFIAVALIWGTSFILMHKAALAMGAVSIAAWRLLLGGGVLWLVWRFTRRGEPWPKFKGHRRALLMLALGGYGVPYIIQPYFIAHAHSTALMAIIISLVPLLTIAVSVPMLGIKPTWRQILGVIGGLLCLYELLHVSATQQHVEWFDMLLACLVPLTYAIANTYVRMRFHDRPALALSADALGLAGIFLLPYALLTEPVHTEQLPLALTALVLLGLLGTGLGTWAFYTLVHKRGPLFAGMVTYVVPVIALGWGWLDGERLAPRQIVAMVGIMAMVAVVHSEKGKAPEMPAAAE